MTVEQTSAGRDRKVFRGRKILKRVALAGLVLTLVSACSGATGTGSGGGAGQPVGGGTLDVGVTSDITSLNPYDGTGESTVMVTGQLNAQLFKSSGKKVVPALAQGLERSADGKTATITLRKGMKFSDGKAITPADVVFSIEQAKSGGVYGSLYKEIITSQKASGDDKVVLTLVRPTINLEALLSYPRAAIIPADFGGRQKDAYYQEPVGAGPYSLGARRPGTSIMLKKNPNYWDNGKPHLDTVNFQVFNSVNALTSAYQAKTIQAVPFAPRESVPSFAGANVVSAAASSTELLFVNGRGGPLSDARVRKAISVAIDRESIVQKLGGPGDKPSETYLPATVLGEAKPAPVKDNDAEQAKQLLSQTEFKNGATIKLIYPTGDATLANTVQAMQAALAKAGITLQTQALDLGAWVDNVLAGQYELAYQSVSDPGSTAESTMAFYISTKGFGGGWSTDVAKASLQEYQEATNPASQAAALDKFQNWVGTELPVIPTVSVRPSLVLGSRVGGYEGLGEITQQALPFEELWIGK